MGLSGLLSAGGSGCTGIHLLLSTKRRRTTLTGVDVYHSVLDSWGFFGIESASLSSTCLPLRHHQEPLKPIVSA